MPRCKQSDKATKEKTNLFKRLYLIPILHTSDMCSRVRRVRAQRCTNRFIRQNAKTIASKVQGPVKQRYDLHTGPV